MSFHDLQFDLAEERIEGLHREAESYRTARQTIRARRLRARSRRSLWRRSLWRRMVSTPLTAAARMANDVIGATISPPWPTDGEPPYRAWPSAGR